MLIIECGKCKVHFTYVFENESSVLHAEMTLKALTLIEYVK